MGLDFLGWVSGVEFLRLHWDCLLNLILNEFREFILS